MDKEFVYEDAIKELEQIVAKLSEGKVSLDESLKLYTRGVELSNLCQKRLTEIEQKISIVNKDGSVSLLQIENEEE
ncbi:MAG: exodeoxyribonuclease VII small subunit [Clostridia bacterium]|nr:exodeoxyribonuclease VII small subunit [Clostridiales bacterium]MCR5803423.1 exodeoxyribonuclease VII small subunit [Clostridia bacterium]